MYLKRVVLGVDWRQPPASFAFTGAVVVVATQIYRASWHVWAAQPGLVLFFTVLVAVAECMSVRLPHVDGYVSVGSAVCLAGLLTMGAPGAAVASSLGIVLANTLWSAQPLDIVVFNGAQLAITSYVSGLVWVAVGGVPATPMHLPGDVWPLLIVMATYAMVNMSIVTVGISLAARKPLIRIWLAGLRWTIPNYVGTAPLGVLAAEVYYSSFSVYGILLLWIPLLFARYSFQHYWEIRKAHMKTIEALALALDARDPCTAGHSERVALYASTIATHMRLPDAEIERIRCAGILHDIGKIGISDLVLNKKGALDPAEFDLIRGHPSIGAGMLESISFLKDTSEIICHHHERYDGLGYPDRLRGPDILLGARIMAVVDAFDAMTCDRVYRPAVSADEAIRRLVAGKGSQFDPDLVDVFVQVWETTFDHGRLAPLPTQQGVPGEGSRRGNAGKAVTEMGIGI